MKKSQFALVYVYALVKKSMTWTSLVVQWLGEVSVSIAGGISLITDGWTIILCATWPKMSKKMNKGYIVFLNNK